MMHRSGNVALCAFTSLAALIGAGGVGGVVQAQTAEPGWTFTMRVEVDSGRGDSGKSVVVVRTRVAAGMTRTELELPGVENSVMAGMYSVFRSRDSTMTVVIPSRRIASVMSTNGGAGALTQTIRHNVVRTARPTIADLGPGDTILGHATHRYRVSGAGRIDYSVYDQVCSRPFESVSEVWIAPDVPASELAHVLTDNLAAAGLPTGFVAGADSVNAAGLAGTALRTTGTLTDRSIPGRPVIVRTTMSFTELARGPIADSVFAPPADYTVRDMRAMSAQLPPGMLDDAVREANLSLLQQMCGTPSKVGTQSMTSSPRRR